MLGRELNKVYTNGTLVDPELLTDEEAGHCISIFEETNEDNPDNNKFGICVLDCSTSQFDMSSFEDDICRTKLETLMRQLRPKELVFVKVTALSLRCHNGLSYSVQGNFSIPTNRLLKAILPASCLWTGLRTVEGFDYEQTLQEVKTLFPAEESDMADEEDAGSLPASVPETIRSMIASRAAIKALGSMIWSVCLVLRLNNRDSNRDSRYLRQLNIDKDILSMKNFNIYDPLKKGEGLTLDGQTLAHIEVGFCVPISDFLDSRPSSPGPSQ